MAVKVRANLLCMADGGLGYRASSWHLEVLASGKHGPGHASVLGGDGHDRLAKASTLLHGQGPSAHTVCFALGAGQQRPGTQDQQGSQTGVAGLRDFAQPGLAARAVLDRAPGPARRRTDDRT